MHLFYYRIKDWLWTAWLSRGKKKTYWTSSMATTYSVHGARFCVGYRNTLGGKRWPSGVV